MLSSRWRQVQDYPTHILTTTTLGTLTQLSSDLLWLSNQLACLSSGNRFKLNQAEHSLISNSNASGIDSALLLFTKYVDEKPSLRRCKSFPQRRYMTMFGNLESCLEVVKAKSSIKTQLKVDWFQFFLIVSLKFGFGWLILNYQLNLLEFCFINFN